jgi:hypothetical protein
LIRDERQRAAIGERRGVESSLPPQQIRLRRGQQMVAREVRLLFEPRDPPERAIDVGRKTQRYGGVQFDDRVGSCCSRAR